VFLMNNSRRSEVTGTRRTGKETEGRSRKMKLNKGK
jgi:hypothetical protein